MLTITLKSKSNLQVGNTYLDAIKFRCSGFFLMFFVYATWFFEIRSLGAYSSGDRSWYVICLKKTGAVIDKY